MTMNSKTRSKFASAVLASALGLATLAGFASPAQGATTAGTTATFTLTAGGLAITAPASKELGNGSPGGAASAQLGTVKVDDTRGALLATWTAKVSSSSFQTGGKTAAETIANTNVQYWSGATTVTSGTNVFVPGQATALAAATLSAETTAFSATGGVGNNSASWNPTFIVNIPAAAVAGDYTGTVTHSVA